MVRFDVKVIHNTKTKKIFLCQPVNIHKRSILAEKRLGKTQKRDPPEKRISFYTILF